MWDLVDENNNYYTNIEEIKKDFLEVVFSQENRESLEVIKAIMTNNKLNIGEIVDTYPTYIAIPIIDKLYYGGDKVRYYKLSEIISETESRRLTELSTHRLKAFSDNKITKAKAKKIDKNKLFLIYSPRKRKIYLGGWNQSEDYEFRKLVRAGQIQIPKRVEEQEQEEEEEYIIGVHENLEEMGLEEVVEEKFNLGKEIGREQIEFINNSIYSFKGCIENGCERGISKHKKSGLKVCCPECKNIRGRLIKERLIETRTNMTIREILNIPECIEMNNEILFDNRIIEICTNLKKTVILEWQSCIALYESLLIMYLYMIKATPIQRVKSATRMTSMILVLRVEKGEEIELKKIIREREQAGLRTIALME